MNWVLLFVSISALLIGLVNGLYLLWNNIRDKPKLLVKAIHPETYQWYFRLPDRTYEGNTIRKYGFLTYIDISNQGLRDVAVNRWRLNIKLQNGQKVELNPISITEPEIQLGDMGSKKYPVLGCVGVTFKGDTMVRSGDSIAGFAYYFLEVYDSNEFNPYIKDEKAMGKMVVGGVYGKDSKCDILFNNKSLEEVRRMIPNIETVG